LHDFHYPKLPIFKIVIFKGPLSLLGPPAAAITTTPMPQCNATCQYLTCEKDVSYALDLKKEKNNLKFN
jgi:hypothetical protein